MLDTGHDPSINAHVYMHVYISMIRAIESKDRTVNEVQKQDRPRKLRCECFKSGQQRTSQAVNLCIYPVDYMYLTSDSHMSNRLWTQLHVASKQNSDWHSQPY